jgi:ATP-dependent Clp protease adaptor protein ClpS
MCKHDPIQAEQCAVTAHNVGKCVVKSGAFLDMFELKTTFDDLDIKSEIEEYASGMY